MTDIILVEYRGKSWLVRGEEHIDALLINALPPDISMDIITCEAESDVNNLMLREGWNAEQGRMPWIINPEIMSRIHRSKMGQSVFFGQWSALLDENALELLRSIATAMEEIPSHNVFLVSYNEPDQPQAMTDLTNLRCGLMEAELGRLGVAASRISREARDAREVKHADAGTQRIDIRVAQA